VAITACVLQGSAQSDQAKLPEILIVSKPRRGIYLSFQEFLSNAPSVDSDFELKSRSKGKQYLLGGSDYRLLLKDSLTKKREVRKFWGVSTGDSIYINVNQYQENRGFVKLQMLGRYCYVIGSSSFARETGLGGALASIPYEVGYVLNINNGKFYALDHDMMLRILEMDEELSRSYAAEKNKSDVYIMLRYIDKYNLRHVAEIGQKGKTVKVILYRRVKKERLDTVQVKSGDSLLYKVSTNDIEVLYSKGNTIRLCANGDCSDFPLMVNQINYFECSYSPADVKPKIEPRSKKEGEFYTREIGHSVTKR
jgi:hypothetical protein